MQTVVKILIAAAGGAVGLAGGIGIPAIANKKTGYGNLTVPGILAPKNDEEIQVDEEGNPIVKAVEIKEEKIFHPIKEEKPKSPFKAGPKKSDKNVNGVETVEPENK
jgi:hypothetical protein